MLNRVIELLGLGAIVWGLYLLAPVIALLAVGTLLVLVANTPQRGE